MSKKSSKISKLPVDEEPIQTPVIDKESDAEFEAALSNAAKDASKGKVAEKDAPVVAAPKEIDSSDVTKMTTISFLALACVGYFYFFVYHARGSTEILALAGICVLAAILLSNATQTVADRRYRALHKAFSSGSLPAGDFGSSASGFSALANVGSFFFLFYLLSTHVLPSARGILQAPSLTDNLYFEAGISALVPAALLVAQAQAKQYLF